MIIRTFDDYSRFRCLCGDCPDTCCHMWDVVVDEESRLRYLRMENGIGRKAVSRMQKIDGEWCFPLHGGRCPFLMDNDLCEMQAQLGEEALCRTCRQFPRVEAEFGGTKEIVLSLSCPEAARMLLSHTDKIAFTRTRNDEPPALNDIDADLYARLLDMRTELISLAQDRSLPVSRRIALCLTRAADLWRGESRARPVKGSIGYGRLLNALKGMERLTDRWGGYLERMEKGLDALKPFETWETEFENLLVYYLARYFLTAVYDGRYYLSVKLAAVSLCALRLLFSSVEGDRADLLHLYSREVENSQDNLDALCDLLSDGSFGNRRVLLGMIEA